MQDLTRSLMHHVAAPVIVGERDGVVVYVNPAFETRFQAPLEEAIGQPLASLFEGGGREEVLRAVAIVCSEDRSVSFRLREGDAAYNAVASPIVAGDEGGVGVVILMLEEFVGVLEITGALREVENGLDEVTRCLAEIEEQTGGRRATRYSQAVSDSARALDHARKYAGTLRRAVVSRGIS